MPNKSQLILALLVLAKSYVQREPDEAGYYNAQIPLAAQMSSVTPQMH